MYEDRMFRGFLAGVAGGIAMNIFSLFTYLLNLTELPFWQWAAIMVLGRDQISGTAENILGIVTHLIFTGFMGILFSFLVPHLKSRGIVIKGWFFAVGAWFSIYALTLLFKVKGTVPILLKTAVSNFVGATIYGIVLGWMITKLYIKATT
ncbi:MAG: DUF6789 family protein [Bacillota bacterium]|nr:DUF6789 family protein [Bacillota bacterium]MDW7683972.1 DUF6789 family protein [Bacillota bacterium]